MSRYHPTVPLLKCFNATHLGDDPAPAHMLEIRSWPQPHIRILLLSPSQLRPQSSHTGLTFLSTFHGTASHTLVHSSHRTPPAPPWSPERQEGSGVKTAQCGIPTVSVLKSTPLSLFPHLRGTGNGTFGSAAGTSRYYNVRNSRFARPADPPRGRRLTARSRPAASPALGLVSGLSITCQARPSSGTFSRRRPGPPPCISPGVCPFSFCSASSAPRSPSSAGGLLRRDQAGEESERTPLNLKPPLARVGVPHGSPSRCTPLASARAHSGARRGPIASCATALARRARPGLGLHYPEDRPVLHSPFRCACALHVLLGLDLPFCVTALARLARGREGPSEAVVATGCSSYPYRAPAVECSRLR